MSLCLCQRSLADDGYLVGKNSSVFLQPLLKCTQFSFSTHIQVPFLNLMSNIQQRAGSLDIRLGGNTQEFAVHVESLDNFAAVGKEKSNLQNPVRRFHDLGLRPPFFLTPNIDVDSRCDIYH